MITMSKIEFDKLNITLPEEVNSFDFNGNEITVKKYLPINEKLEMISDIINNSDENAKFYNLGKMKVYTTIGIMEHYTNVELPEDYNPTEVFDAFKSSGLIDKVCEIIGEDEMWSIESLIGETIKAIYAYNQSFAGFMESASKNYDVLQIDADKLAKDLGNPEQLKLLREVMTKLG